MSEGKFQFDLWNVQPSDRYNWEELRQDIMRDGVANSLLIALMPTASTSQILGNNECFEPITSNIYTRRTIAGDFVVINKYLVVDLMKLGLWNSDMKNKIIANNGSVQSINEIPQDIKNLYKTVWEIKQKVLIDQAIDRGPFICQTQSMNLFFEEPTQNMLTGALFHGWKNGLKTGSYYIRTKPKAQAQQFTIDPNSKVIAKVDEPCEMCSA
jgi:ribonucleoside-diphosphate reductase alpha chain